MDAEFAAMEFNKPTPSVHEAQEASYLQQIADIGRSTLEFVTQPKRILTATIATLALLGAESSPASVTSASSPTKAEQCAELGTKSPTNMKITTRPGTKRIRNLSFSLPAVNGCDAEGKRTVKYGIEEQPLPKGDFYSVTGLYTAKTNSKKNIKADGIWAISCNEGRVKNHVVVRPDIDVIWKPKHGTATKVHYPSENSTHWPKNLCK